MSLFILDGKCRAPSPLSFTAHSLLLEIFLEGWWILGLTFLPWKRNYYFIRSGIETLYIYRISPFHFSYTAEDDAGKGNGDQGRKSFLLLRSIYIGLTKKCVHFFSITLYGKTWMNFGANPIYDERASLHSVGNDAESNLLPQWVTETLTLDEQGLQSWSQDTSSPCPQTAGFSH